MNVPDAVIDLLESSFILGTPMQEVTAKSFKKKFRKNPAKYFVAFVLATEKKSHEFWPPLCNILMHATNEEILARAEKMLRKSK